MNLYLLSVLLVVANLGGLESATIYATIDGDNNMSELKAYVDKVDSLKATLKEASGDKYTIIAPRNDGFSTSLKETLKDDTKLEEYLKFLMVKGEVLTADFDGLNHETEHATAKMRLCVYDTSPKTFVAQGAVLSSTTADNDKACDNGKLHAVLKAPEMPMGTIYEYISKGEKKEQFTKLKKALDEANFNTMNTLTGDMPVNFFAPTDAALKKISDIDKMIDFKCNMVITALLGNHMLMKKKTYYSAGLVNDQTMTTYWNNDVNNKLKMVITGSGDATVYKIGTTKNAAQSKIITKDVSVTNGVIHIIDNVLQAKGMPTFYYCQKNGAGSLAISTSILLLVSLLTSYANIK